MKTQHFNRFTYLKIGLISLITLCSSLSFAGNNSGKDKALLIRVDAATHCVISVSPADNKQDCKLESPNPCKNDPECVCAKKEKYIAWTTSTGDNFDINFTQGSPFKKCDYQSENAKGVRCKIKNNGDFYYEINVKGCATNPYDPRIVVH